MTTKISMILKVAIFMLQPALASSEVNCSQPPACPNGTKEISLCIIDPDVAPSKWNLATRLIEHNNCEGEDRRSIVVADQRGIEIIFRDAISRCERIKDLRFTGHGAPGYTAAGRLTTESLKRLRPLNCVMAADAKIDVLGCNTGRGCLGQMFMYSVAENLLPRGGDVIGTTFYASVILPYPKHISLDGTRRILKVRPGTNEPETWWLNSPIRTRQTPPSESCVSEIDESLAVLDIHDKFAGTAKKCAIPADSQLRKTAEALKARRKELLKIDEFQKSFASIARATTGGSYQGKTGGFTGISNAALELVDGLQPYLACRRKLVNGRMTVPSSTNREGEIAR